MSAADTSVGLSEKDRKLFMKRKKKIITVFILFACLFAGWIIRDNATIGLTRYTAAGNRVPSSFDGFKIIVLSDIHNAKFNDRNEQLLQLVQKETPDMIAVTGDLVDSRHPDFEKAESLMRHLVKIAPCYYVTGNHEACLGERYLEFENRLKKLSVAILHDQVVKLSRNDETIQIAGLDDPDFTERDPSLQQSMQETKLQRMHVSKEYSILLTHRPENFDAYVNSGIDLVFSGHAHGGQVRLPLIGGLAAPNQGFFPRYDAGMYEEKQTSMIVSRGIGNSIIPVRINNPPEIVCVRLKHLEK